MRKGLLPLLAGALLASAGCEDFLTLDPETFISQENYYRTPQHIEQAVTAVYARTRGLFSGDWRLLGDLRGDLTTLQFNINVPGFTFQIDEFTEATNDNTIGAQYNAIFRTIFDANVVLSRIDGVSFEDPQQKERLRAEALFARALAYWQAVQFWGLGERWAPDNLAVPLILEELTDPDQAFQFERATVRQVVDQIIQDLTYAKQHLPPKSAVTGANAGRFTRGAATFLLGATYQLDPSPASQQAALAEFEELATQGYALVTTGTAASGGNAFREVFNPANKNNVESILEFQYNVNLEVGALRQNLVPGMSPLNAEGGGNGGDASLIPVYGDAGEGSYMPTQNHILSFAGADPSGPETPLDLRYEGGYGVFCPGSGVSGRLGDVPDVLRTRGDITLRSPNPAYPELNIERVRDPVNRSVRENCIPYYAKWRWPEHMPQPGRDNNNWIAFRYADALLRRAESLARLGRAEEALQFVNEVRARAGLPPLSGLAGEALLDAILQERAWELAGEGHRWLDLKRFGKASEVILAHGEERARRVSRTPPAAYMRDGSLYRLRFPIRPRDVELSQCRILQNPGWGTDCVGN
ncbi:MAG TPA: RagB/SusD family nutrient uptake outer membrane protein [Longimicrobiales bacterium]